MSKIKKAFSNFWEFFKDDPYVNSVGLFVTALAGFIVIVVVIFFALQQLENVLGHPIEFGKASESTDNSEISKPVRGTESVTYPDGTQRNFLIYDDGTRSVEAHEFSTYVEKTKTNGLEKLIIWVIFAVIVAALLIKISCGGKSRGCHHHPGPDL